jgi:O-glycosyl hydrolase
MVDTSTRFQTLVGFGAGVAYTDDEIVRHPRKAALYQAMFADLGSDVLRLRNRYGSTDPNLASFAEIVTAAAESLGRKPTVLVTSFSPPAALKANGSPQCAGNPETCTLTRLAGGGFDYAAFATHWRGSVEAYANAGIPPDYIGLQNNPNWVPDASAAVDACKFLPTEGTATVSTDSGDVEVAYPGFAPALAAVAAELANLSSAPRIMAPETSDYQSVAEYLSSLDSSSVAAIAHHLYGTDPAAVDTTALANTGQLGRQYQLPIFQSEMQAEGFETALLMHDALAVEGVSVYVQAGFAESASSLTGNSRALIAMGTADFTIQLPYHAMRHYSRHTDPGWVRVAAESTATDLLASAWLSPAEDALTVVLLNSGLTEVDVKMDAGQTRWTSSQVTRTAFEGVERSAELGAVPAQGVVRVPSHAILTVALRR